MCKPSDLVSKNQRTTTGLDSFHLQEGLYPPNSTYFLRYKIRIDKTG